MDLRKQIFEHFFEKHNLILLDDDIDDVINLFQGHIDSDTMIA